LLVAYVSTLAAIQLLKRGEGDVLMTQGHHQECGGALDGAGVVPKSDPLPPAIDPALKRAPLLGPKLDTR
jgi:hypothetical protein